MWFLEARFEDSSTFRASNRGDEMELRAWCEGFRAAGVSEQLSERYITWPLHCDYDCTLRMTLPSFARSAGVARVYSAVERKGGR